MFNLVLSLLPAKVKSVVTAFLFDPGSYIRSRGIVGFFGFNSDRRLALHALGVAATKDDSHAVFAGLIIISKGTTENAKPICF